MTVSVQDTVGSAIAFAAITQLGATVPEKLLRCVLNCDDMVTLKTATSTSSTATAESSHRRPPDSASKSTKKYSGTP